MAYHVYLKDGIHALQRGDVVTTFRGELVTFFGVTRTPEPEYGKSGKVLVTEDDGLQRECYPGVINAEIR